MPRFFLFGSTPNLILNSVTPHFLPYCRSIENVSLDTSETGSPFSVSVRVHPTRDLEIYLHTSSRISVTPEHWKRHLLRHLDVAGDTDLHPYRDLGLSSYLSVIVAKFFSHIRKEECLCFEPLREDMSEPRSQRVIDTGIVARKKNINKEDH